MRCRERKEPIVWPTEGKRVLLACDQQVLASLGRRTEKEREGWVEGGMNGWGREGIHRGRRLERQVTGGFSPGLYNNGRETAKVTQLQSVSC